ncbi:hemin ABC transporter ATP-binding protein [Opitutaceae bacterium TAV5]|nr:hemin ABC transporter ATP-binding protein [Opitutaceae bacterium TAV5]
MTTASHVLSARGLAYTVDAGRKTLLADVDLTLRPGEFHAIIGRNGAGKSTLLKLLTGELHPTAGEIELWQIPLARHRARHLARRRGVLAQHTELHFDYRALEVVLLGRIPHQRNQIETDADVAIALDCLHRVGLAGYEDRNYLTLSGGEQQRVHLARVLAQVTPGDAHPDDAASPDHRPLLFLDEPTSSLDLHHQNQVLEIARSLTRDRGAAVLAVLHDLNLAARYADTITLLTAGRVTACGTPDAVLREDTLRHAFSHEVRVQRHPCFDCPLVISA